MRALLVSYTWSDQSRKIGYNVNMLLYFSFSCTKTFQPFSLSEKKPRNLSAASRRSNQSLNTFQRRHILESMVVKKQTPLESKKFMHVKDCVRVEKKVDNFLKSFSDWMKIATPDISLIEFDPDKHDTPFAKDVNISDWCPEFCRCCRGSDELRCVKRERDAGFGESGPTISLVYGVERTK